MFAGAAGLKDLGRVLAYVRGNLERFVNALSGGQTRVCIPRDLDRVVQGIAEDRVLASLLRAVSLYISLVFLP